jgi:hypothetical protein
MHSSPLTFNIELLTSIFHFRGWPLGCCPLRSLHYFRVATEGRLGIDHPVVAVQAADQFRELRRVGQSRCWTGAV